jgi:hypothetical protein
MPVACQAGRTAYSTQATTIHVQAYVQPQHISPPGGVDGTPTSYSGGYIFKPRSIRAFVVFLSRYRHIPAK